MLNCMHTLQQADLIWVLHNNAAGSCLSKHIDREVSSSRKVDAA